MSFYTDPNLYLLYRNFFISLHIETNLNLYKQIYIYSCRNKFIFIHVETNLYQFIYIQANLYLFI